MVVELKILAAAVEEYDRTKPARDTLWKAAWTYVDNCPKGKFKTTEFDRLTELYYDAESAAERKIGEAMWAEPTNINSYDKCMTLVTADIARKWLANPMSEAEYRRRQRNYKKWLRNHPDVKLPTGEINAGHKGAIGREADRLSEPVPSSNGRKRVRGRGPGRK